MLPILKTTKDFYCQYCFKTYKSSSKRKAHILKNHPGAELPVSTRGTKLPVVSNRGSRSPVLTASCGGVFCLLAGDPGMCCGTG